MTILIKLAHISDLHLTQVHRFPLSTWNFKRCLGYLNWIIRRRTLHSQALADKVLQDMYSQDVDHVVLTGDIINLGLRREHEDARSWFNIQELSHRMSLVPGNHDIYADPIDGESCLQNWKEFMSSDQASFSFLSFGSTQFPFVRRLGPLALIGLNSAVPTKLFRADGCLGEPQLEALEVLLGRLKAAGLLRVLLIHHPPIPGLTPLRRALKDAPRLLEILKEKGVELILHGHNHKPSVAWLESRIGAPIPIIGVGSGSATFQRGSDLLASYHLFEFSINQKSYEISMIHRGLMKREGELVEIYRDNLWPQRNRPKPK